MRIIQSADFEKQSSDDFIRQLAGEDQRTVREEQYEADLAHLPPVRPGCKRFFHATPQQNIDSILSSGIGTGAERGKIGQEPWVSGYSRPRSFVDSRDAVIVVDIPANDRNADLSGGEVRVYRHISPEEIVGVLGRLRR